MATMKFFIYAALYENEWIKSCFLCTFSECASLHSKVYTFNQRLLREKTSHHPLAEGCAGGGLLCSTLIPAQPS